MSSTSTHPGTSTPASARTDTDIVRTGFAAVAAKDLGAFAAVFQAQATWNHRNEDRLGGIKQGADAILNFLRESIELTAGTLQAVPEVFMPDGEGHVAVLTRVTGSRPDGRSFDDLQVLLFTLTGGLVHSVDQFVGAPAAVSAFWA